MTARGEIQSRWITERHLHLAFHSVAGELAAGRVLAGLGAIRRLQVPSLIDVTPSAFTLLLEFEPALLVPREVERTISRAVTLALNDDRVARTATVQASEFSSVEIPVCYAAPFAPDIESVANLQGLSPKEVVALHSSVAYSVAFVGFSPGFGYLRGLPASLATPRLDSPRPRVPAGSVGIGGDQTGVYPLSTPGGWRLIGRTPLVMFDAHRQTASLLRAGDRVCFVPISVAEFQALSRGEADA